MNLVIAMALFLLCACTEVRVSEKQAATAAEKCGDGYSQLVVISLPSGRFLDAICKDGRRIDLGAIEVKGEP